MIKKERNIESIYKSIDRNFYSEQTKSKNFLRKWFHLNRYRIANSLVKSKYKKNYKIADLGCGSCDWNIDNLNVFGIDLNEKLLKLAKQKNQLYNYKVVDTTNSGLPNDSFDIVVAFEFLEHINDYEKIVIEAKRLLKKGGYCIISVPYDVFFSLWKPLFFVQVLFHGYILQNQYYKKRCGHVNHFSTETIKNAFIKHGFDIDTVFVMRGFTIFLCAQKRATIVETIELYDDLTIILPTLNEEENIESMLSFITSHYRGCEIIVSDDGSQDNTKKIVLNFKNNKLTFLDRTNRKVHGLTVSILDAIDLVKTKYFVVIDADGQHPPKKIEEIVNTLRLGHKIVAASRVEVEKQWSFCRRLISYLGTSIGKISLLLRGKNYLNYDILGGFFGCETRFWKKCFHKLKKKKFRLRGYKIFFDLLKYLPSRLEIEEVYYKFETRKADVSKINPKIYLEFLKGCLFK